MRATQSEPAEQVVIPVRLRGRTYPLQPVDSAVVELHDTSSRDLVRNELRDEIVKRLPYLRSPPTSTTTKAVESYLQSLQALAGFRDDIEAARAAALSRELRASRRRWKSQ